MRGGYLSVVLATAAPVLCGLSESSTHSLSQSSTSELSKSSTLPESSPSATLSSTDTPITTSITISTSTSTGTSTPIPTLQCFEVVPPVRGPLGPVSPTTGSVEGVCTLQLMDHGFGFSYGRPFVANYTPPSDAQCPGLGAWDRVVANLTVSSVGRQFDRLALVFLGDVEVWRTSTAEPSPGVPIAWTQWADLTPYMALWRAPQRLVVDLGNLVDETYTGVFQTTLTVTFFKENSGAKDEDKNKDDDKNKDEDNDKNKDDDKSKIEEGQNEDDGKDEDKDEKWRPADVIVPITARRAGESKPSHWVYPSPDKAAANISNFPRTARRAVLAVSATGQMVEEFWWANQLESDRDRFPPGKQPGLSPFREVQILIDGAVAGLQWPFPVVFTGGYAPNMHRPVVGIGAFTLREAEIDVSPWLPVLCDGGEHTIELAVVGVADDGKGGAKLAPVTGQYWVLSAKVFVWLGEDIVEGDKPKVTLPETEITYHSSVEKSDNADAVLVYDISVARHIEVTGAKKETRWTQKVAFTGTGRVRGSDGYQAATISLSGEDEASGPARYVARYTYPTSLEYSPVHDVETGEAVVSVELNQTRNVFVGGVSAFMLDTEPFRYKGEKGDGVFTAYLSETTRNASAVMVRPPEQKYVVRRAASAVQRFRLHGWVENYKGDKEAKEEVYTRFIRAVNDSVVEDVEVLQGEERVGGRGVYAGEWHGDAEFAYGKVWGSEGHDGGQGIHAEMEGEQRVLLGRVEKSGFVLS